MFECKVDTKFKVLLLVSFSTFVRCTTCTYTIYCNQNVIAVWHFTLCIIQLKWTKMLLTLMFLRMAVSHMNAVRNNKNINKNIHSFTSLYCNPQVCIIFFCGWMSLMSPNFSHIPPRQLLIRKYLHLLGGGVNFKFYLKLSVNLYGGSSTMFKIS